MKWGMSSLIADLSVDGLERIHCLPPVSFSTRKCLPVEWSVDIVSIYSSCWGLQGNLQVTPQGLGFIPGSHGHTACEHQYLKSVEVWTEMLPHIRFFLYIAETQNALQTGYLYTMYLYQMSTHNVDYWGLATVTKTVSVPPHTHTHNSTMDVKIVCKYFPPYEIGANICVSLL